MRMPRFQYSSSPSMSGAYSSPVLRSAPTLRTPALRNTSKYLRDPRAGQRNMQLEVQAELDKAKPFQALVAGAGEIAETFLKADMKSKLTEAELNLRITTEGLLANMKSMPVGAASTTIDGKTGQPDTNYRAVHETSLASFTNEFSRHREKISKTLPRAAKDQFLAGTAAYVASAEAQAQAINRKQHVAYLQGTVFSNLRKAETLAEIDIIAGGADARLVYAQDDLLKLVDARKRELANDYFATTVIAENTQLGLENLENVFANNNRESQIIDENGNTIPMTGAQMRQFEFMGHLTADDKLAFDTKIQAKIKRLQAEDELRKESNKNSIMGEIYNNPDPNVYTSDAFTAAAASGEINFEDIPDLDAIVKAQIVARSQAAPATDVSLQNHILDNIGDFAYRTERLMTMPLDPNFAKEALEKRRRFDQGIPDWKDKNNPAGNKGARANRIFENAFYRKDGGFMDAISIFSPDRVEQLNDRYFIAAKELDEYANNEIDLAMADSEYTFDEAFDNIYLKAEQLAEKERQYSQTVKQEKGAFDLAKDAGFTGSTGQFSQYNTWSRNNNQFTFDDVLQMDPGPARTEKAKTLQSFGWTFDSKFFEEKLKTETAEEKLSTVEQIWKVLLYKPFASEDE